MPSKSEKILPDNNLYAMPAHLIRRCHQIAQGLFHEECAKHDLTPIQYGVLLLLQKHAGVDQITLAGLAALNRSTAGDVLKRLEAAGLIERHESPEDRRVWLVHLTPEGDKLIRKVEALVLRVQERLLEPLNPQERTIFLDCLARIADENNERSRAPLRSPAAA
ncbi:MAG: MarR family transcriptional regulator [Rhodocyclaceae bacterium]|nr:MAG: MarR family transcriptional regulator [Rhodocyclaceae bacterium]